ncbi:1878_t:CDS:2 [Funneliformis geosporum]|uniref:17687_t:CDS:1 n=1 Tax=Funneliformis geosporum TaxID=1117311 RepID=A0A9W4SU01_9GLOM|nr:1878_t:CDS:2 [Funneliformis geosporum]CAI2181503.1 17687_t:CDS:2 [Funneliformis geosporum]
MGENFAKTKTIERMPVSAGMNGVPIDIYSDTMHGILGGICKNYDYSSDIESNTDNENLNIEETGSKSFNGKGINIERNDSSEESSDNDSKDSSDAEIDSSEDSDSDRSDSSEDTDDNSVESSELVDISNGNINVEMSIDPETDSVLEDDGFGIDDPIPELNEEDGLHSEQLELLEKSEKIREFLKDDYLREIILEIDHSARNDDRNVETLLDNRRKNDEMFNNFTEEILNLIYGPPKMNF